MQSLGDLGRYELIRPLSMGGMAWVFEARRRSLAGVAPRVAIKIILPEYAADDSFQQLFVNEARIGSRLQHQNLVQIQDFDQTRDHLYLVMEYVEGITLRRVINLCRRHGRLVPLPLIAEICRQVCDGLDYLHSVTDDGGNSLNLVHRDIKPSNIMLNPQGVLKVLDYGVSKGLLMAEREGSIKGTWGYMSPEQALGQEVGPWADQFGLAAVVYELATLNSLFPEKDPALLKDLLLEDTAARRAVSLSGEYGPLVPPLIRALQRDPAARFPSALAMGQAFSGLIPDPVLLRKQLLGLYDSMKRLADGGASSPQTASWSTLSRSSPVAASRASFSAVEPVHSGSSTGGLPLAVGLAPEGLLPEPAEPEPEPVSLAWRILSGVGIALALLVLVLAGLRAWELWTPDVRRAATGTQGGWDGQPSVNGLLDLAVEEATPGTTTLAHDRTEPAQVLPLHGQQGRSQVGGSSASLEKHRDAEEQDVTDAAGSSSREPTPPAIVQRTGLVTISSMPRSRVFIDGKDLGWVPLFQRKLKAGIHEVRLETEDGASKSFTLEVEPGSNVTRIWHFASDGWAER